MKAKLKQVLLKIVRQLLYRLDPSVNGNLSYVRSETVLTNLTIVDQSPTLILNEKSTLLKADQLKALVDSFLASDSLHSFRSAALDYLLQLKTLTDFDGAVKSVYKFVSNLLKETDNNKNFELLNDLEISRINILKNKLAYSKDQKLNPDAVFWPDPTYEQQPRSLFTEIPFALTNKFITRNTKISSAGSCFAIEIAHRLQKEKFNYVVTERNTKLQSEYAHASAAWGTIFNAPAMCQLVEKSFGVKQLPKILWTTNGKFYDPFREDIIFDSVEEYEANYANHIQACRKALQEVDVFVMTLGMNEVWFYKPDQSVFSRSPWGIAPHLVESRVLTVAENLEYLNRMLRTWRNFNPNLKIIVSVSPVPLHATFRANEQHVIAANAHSKSTLRVVAEEFAKNKDVFYFPSYEVVMYCTENAWEKDQRHVSRHAVDKVMCLFEKMFRLE